MTDKFEEWLEWIIQANLFSKSLPFDARAHEDFYNAGQHDLAKEALAKYREFLKEQSEKAAPYDITKFYPENTDARRQKKAKK